VPQFATLVCVLTHWLLQTVRLFAQVVAHAPETQAWPEAHPLPQPPQL
jgi:hypothetical protein